VEMLQESANILDWEKCLAQTRFTEASTSVCSRKGTQMDNPGRWWDAVRMFVLQLEAGCRMHHDI